MVLLEQLNNRVHRAASVESFDAKDLDSTLSDIADLSVFKEFPLSHLVDSKLLVSLIELAKPKCISLHVSEEAIK